MTATYLGLICAQVANSSLEYKERVLAIIDEPPALAPDPDNGRLVDRRVIKLKGLEGREVWKDLLRRYFSKMRNANAVIITYRGPKIEPLAPDRTLKTRVDVGPLATPAFISLPAAPAAQKPPFYMAVYSNMLLDLLAVPNLGVEFYLGKGWSIAGSWMHAWWNHDRRHRYWRLYGGELRARRWFGGAAHRKPLTGHHLGVYVQALTYDFEWGGKAHMGGQPGGTIFDRAHWGAGVEYGYSLPVARRLNIDFSIGVGYLGGREYEFEPEGDRYLWTHTGHNNWFGPTKLEVSLVWLIGRGNVNARSSGKKEGGAI